MQTRKNWEENAAAWTVLSRAGFDVYRDAFNTPAFLMMLPEVVGLKGIDLGCGEGYNTRLLIDRGAQITGLDHSGAFVKAAARKGCSAFVQGDGRALPFRSGSFDFATAFMSLMDMMDVPAVLREVARILRPGGFFQFSVMHPCFSPPWRKNLRDASGQTRAIEVGAYYDEGPRTESWLFSSAPPEIRAAHKPFTIQSVHLTLSSWFAVLRETGFTIEDLREPKPTPEALEKWPTVQDATVVAYFLHIRARLAAQSRL